MNKKLKREKRCFMPNKVLIVAADIMLADILNSLADRLANFIRKNLDENDEHNVL